MATTTYMNLTLPNPTVTIGPDWANELNAAISVIDDHDHTSGKGRPITQDALELTSDLSINNNNLIEVNSYRMDNLAAVLSGPSDITSAYAVGGDLYYNNASGTPVRITNGAGLDASTIGGIGGDYGASTASLDYSSANQTFTFDQDTGEKALIDVGSVSIREPGLIGANAIVVQSPAALPSGYDLTLGTGLPASKKIVSIDASGNLGYDYDVDGTSIEIDTNTIQIKDAGVTTDKLDDLSVTAAKIANDSIGVTKLADLDIDSDTVTPGSYPSVTEVASINISGVDTGRVIMINIQGTQSSGASITADASVGALGQIYITRNGVTIWGGNYGVLNNGAPDAGDLIIPSMTAIDIAPATSNNQYKLFVEDISILGSIQMVGVRL